MRVFRLIAAIAAFILIGGLSACSDTKTKSPEVTDSIRHSLEQAGLKDVSVSQDQDKGVVTLTGTVTSDAEKAQAEMIASSHAPSQVVSNQLAVRPPGGESVAKKVDSDLDKGIEKNLDAELLKLRLDHDVNYDVKNGVVTLKGSVNSQSKRAMVEKVTKSVPNVQQVVNELEVKNQKATTSK
jgi:hyperosmotically inducible periplasmic protein